MKPKIIVVTGGAGYIGSHVVHNLLANNFAVAVIDDLSSGQLANVNSVVRFLKAIIVTVNCGRKLFRSTQSTA